LDVELISSIALFGLCTRIFGLFFKFSSGLISPGIVGILHRSVLEIVLTFPLVTFYGDDVLVPSVGHGIHVHTLLLGRSSRRQALDNFVTILEGLLFALFFRCTWFCSSCLAIDICARTLGELLLLSLSVL
jgi:hypothetical protein